MSSPSADSPTSGTLRDRGPAPPLHAPHAALVDLAFGSLMPASGLTLGGHLALLPADALDLDLSDPAQRAFGDYELLELLGEGGMGVVYRARQLSLDREVAIKLLAAGPWASHEFIARFLREAKHSARMQHPNIVTVYEIGTVEEMHFFSMRLVRGNSLAIALRRQGPFEPQRAAALMRTIAEAVAYAHGLDVLHLDLKPANVLLDEHGVPHVADFGLARRLGGLMALDNTELSGTPSYMAPEQAELGAQPLSPATDIWGLGTILYELVTGHPPFRGETAQTTLALLRKGAVRRPRRSRPDLPLDLDAIIVKCLARDPAARYVSARALADELMRFGDQRPVQARPLNAMQRVGRWMRREPKLAATAVLALGALLIGLAATTQQWRRAEINAATSSERLWESRRKAALRLQLDGKGFEALPALIANIDEQERATGTATAAIERREVGAILGQGVTLIDRMIVPDAVPLAVELSPDGSVLALALDDLTVRWFNSATLRESGRVELAGLPTSDGSLRAPRLLRFVDNQRLRVTLDWPDFLANPNNGNTYLVDLRRAQVIEPPFEYADAIFSADGQHALLHTNLREIQLWQVEPWQALSAASAERDHWSLPWVLGRDARYAAVINGSDGSVELREPRDLAKALPIVMPTEFTVLAGAESHDGSLLALGDSHGRASLIDLRTRAVRSLSMPAGREVSWIAFSEDDAWLAIVRQDGAAYAFDVASGDPLNAGGMPNDFVPRQVAISHRQRVLIAAGFGETAIWQLPAEGPTAQEATRLLASPTRSARAGTNAVGISMASGLLATANMDGEVRLWRLPRSPILPARAATQIASNLTFDGAQVPDVAYDRLRVVRTKGTAPSAWIRLTQPVGFAELIDGGRVLVATAGPTLHIFDAATLRARHAPIALPANPLRLAANERGDTLVLAFTGNGLAGFEEHLVEYDLRSGKRRDGGVVLRGPLRQLEWASDGSRLLATGPVGGTTDVLARNGLLRLGSYRHAIDRPVVWASFSTNGDLWLTARAAEDALAEDADLLRWDPLSGSVREQRRLPGVVPVGVVDALGKPLLAARDRTLLDPGGPDEHAGARSAHGDATAVFATSHDGRLIAHAFGRDVQLYDAATLATVGAPLRSNLGALDFPAQLAFSADDRQLLGRALLGNWLLWPIAADPRDVAAIRDDVALLSPTQNQGRVPLLADRAQRNRLRRQDPAAWPAPDTRAAIASVRAINGQPVPMRDPRASPLLLDLTQAYNAAPTTLRNLQTTVFAAASQIPFGVMRLDGIDYDVRGLLELRWDQGGGGADRAVPSRATGIPVPPTPIAAFHVLLFAPMDAPAVAYDYANVRLHYRDGSTALLPIRTERDVPGFDDGKVRAAWVRGDHLRLTGGLRQMMLNNPRLPNPHPERLIASLDLEASADHGSTPVFFAVTAEPATSAAHSRMDSVTATVEALHPPARKQWNEDFPRRVDRTGRDDAWRGRARSASLRRSTDDPRLQDSETPSISIRHAVSDGRNGAADCANTGAKVDASRMPASLRRAVHSSHRVHPSHM